MANRKNDYQARKDLVLGIVVNDYIHSVSPVSSAHIASDYHLDLSPATIRNILAELEQDGYLTHPHTSAGRVPTQEGYRYYVDNLMSEIQLLGEEKERIRREYHQGVKDLGNLLEKTSQVISDITHYTSIISLDGVPDRIFCKGLGYVVEYVQTTDLSKIREILRMLEEKEQIFEMINRRFEEKVQIYIGHEMAATNMEICSLAISTYHSPNGMSGRIAVLGPTRMDYRRVVSALDYVSQMMKEVV
jgi:transcriptional regulator of heat shock response